MQLGLKYIGLFGYSKAQLVEASIIFIKLQISGAEGLKLVRVKLPNLL